VKNIIVSLFMLFSPTLTFAATGHDHDHGYDIVAQAYSREEAIKKRLEALETNQAELYHTLAEKKTAGLPKKITERISISGLVELEAALESVKFANGTTDAGSDLILATAQLGFGVEVSEQISGDLILLFEEGENFTLDEVAINLTNDYLFGRFGLQYLPFGVFNSHFISDPLTLELGEIQEAALLSGYNHDLFALSAFVFNGEAEEGNQEDHIRDWGLSLAVTPVENLELGASYISDLADTAAELLDGGYRDRVGGWSAYAILGLGAIEISGEFLGATNSFDAVDLDEDGDGSGDAPMAWNLELAWAVTKNLELAARYEGSAEFAGQPKRQYGVGASWSPRKNVSLSLEYLHGEFDKDFAGDQINAAGSPTDVRDFVTAQLAFEF